MRKLLLSAVVLSTCSLWAQLHVSPSATSDNYIYANDVVLYVEEGVDLERNTNYVQTEASIYLRGDSQLIQGGTSNLNSGNGQLSVWIRGYEDDYGYENWAAPVGNTNGMTYAGSGVGGLNFGITAFYDPEFSGYHLTHSPASANISGNTGYRNHLRIARKWVYVLRGDGNYADWHFVGNANGIEPGDGFTMKGTLGTTFENYQVYDFRGRANSGTITREVPGDGLYAYVGNPYPSNIDLAKFLLHPDNNDIEAKALFYEKSDLAQSHNINEIQSGYGTWVPNGGPNTVPEPYADGNLGAGVFSTGTFVMYDLNGNPLPGTYGNTTVYEARFADVGQGFMVQSTGIGDGVVEFTNDMRLWAPRFGAMYNEFKNQPVEGGGNMTKGNDDGSIGNDDELPVDNRVFLRFYVEMNDTYRRDLPLSLSNQTTTGKDRGWDATHPGLVSKGDAYWVVKGEDDPFVIQARPYDYNEAIPLGIKSGVQPVTYKVKLAEKVNFTGRLYLLDKYTGICQPIYNVGPDEDVNHATIYTNEAVDFNDRYYIVYKHPTDGGIVKSEQTDINFFQNNRVKQLEVYNKDRVAIQNLSLYDMSGKLVISQDNVGDQEFVALSTSRLSDGMYVVMVITQDNQLIDYKINILNKN